MNSILLSLIIASWGVLVLSKSCLDPKKVEACNYVFSPNSTKQNCCGPMKYVVGFIKECSEKTGGTPYSCAVTDCVIGDIYHILNKNDHGDLVVDAAKTSQFLNDLDVKMPSIQPLNRQVRKDCLIGAGFKAYGNSEPMCESKSLLMCGFTSYLGGCEHFDRSSETCRELEQNVKECKPVVKQYLAQTKSH